MQVYLRARRGYQVSFSILLHILPLTGSLTASEARLVVNKPWLSCLSSLHKTKVLDIYVIPKLICGCWNSDSGLMLV